MKKNSKYVIGALLLALTIFIVMKLLHSSPEEKKKNKNNNKLSRGQINQINDGAKNMAVENAKDIIDMKAQIDELQFTQAQKASFGQLVQVGKYLERPVEKLMKDYHDRHGLKPFTHLEPPPHPRHSKLHTPVSAPGVQIVARQYIPNMETRGPHGLATANTPHDGD